MEASMTIDLVGRRREAGLVERAVLRAGAGAPQLLVLGGEAGIGKTRLLDHCAAQLAATGVRVLRGGCVELGCDVPLAPLTATLRDLLHQLGPERLTSLLPGAEPVLGLLPELRLPAPETQVRPYELYAGLLRRLAAEQPVLLVIDDLHWADRPTRDLLGFLARTLRGSRVAVATAYRSDRLRPGDPLPGFLAELERLPGVRRLALAPFGRAETEQLVTAVLGAPAEDGLVDRLLARSGGNPYFIEQLARTGGYRLPASLRDLLLDRVEPLPEPARRVVQLVAVAGETGEPVPHPLLAAVAGLTERALLAAVRSAVDAGTLMTTMDNGYEVRPGLLREVVLAELLPAERTRAHRRYAEALERRPVLATPERLTAWLAYQWRGAGEPGRAVAAAHRAAAGAGARHAYAEQSRLLRLALDLQPGDGVDWQRAALAAIRAGEPAHALALVDRAKAEDAASTPDTAANATLLALRCRALHELGDADAATAAAEAMRALPAQPAAVRAAALDLLATVLAARGRPAAAQILARRAAALGGDDMSTSEESEAVAGARITFACTLAPLGAYEDALDALHLERDRAAGHGDPIGLARVHAGLASALTLLGRLPEAIDAARGSTAPEPALRLAEALLLAGRWDEADQTASAALALDPPRPLAVALHAVRGEVALGQDQLDVAREHRSLAETLLARIAGAVPETLPVACLRAELALCEHRVDEARKAIAEALPVTDQCRVPLLGWRLLVTGARVEARARIRARAFGDELTDESMVPALRQAAAGFPTDTPLLAAYAGWFAAELGVPDPSWEGVAGALDEVGVPYAACYARLRTAEAAVGAGTRAPAEQRLRSAGAEAERLGAVRLLSEIRRLARGADIALDGDAAGEVSDLQRLRLTGREAEVLRLMVVGRTNRQIAQQLYISPKTASVHASRILAKLGVSNRVEAAATAYRLQLFDTEPAT
jgi:DNA-binding CsgD family transcriptional regulator/tetratricopeptide (TPR) repeat protein